MNCWNSILFPYGTFVIVIHVYLSCLWKISTVRSWSVWIIHVCWWLLLVKEAACSQRVTYEKDKICLRHYSMLYYGFFFADAHVRHSTQFPWQIWVNKLELRFTQKTCKLTICFELLKWRKEISLALHIS